MNEAKELLHPKIGIQKLTAYNFISENVDHAKRRRRSTSLFCHNLLLLNLQNIYGEFYQID